ncbi:helix-turn-helix domain-containing protein [Paraconexibacter sp. AEG42_29]|uniref:PucR family transcriptional regulator n=1 Tax=Paraconexibacter sp. AEG42_29 TaxID=2997339 RepID=UPI00339D5266
MTGPRKPLGAPAADLVRAAATLALADPGPLLAAVDEAVLAGSPALAAYADLAQQTQLANHTNVLRWLTSTAHRPGEPVPREVAPEALDIARDVVRRGLDRDVMWTAYRRGENAAWRMWMRALTELAATRTGWTAALPDALDATASTLNRFVDDILSTLDERIWSERDQLVSGNLARRLETVQLILSDAPITQQRAAERLGYELGGDHVALVLTTDTPTPEQGLLETLAARLAHAGGMRPPFTVPAGGAGLWAWAAAPASPDLDAMRAVLRGAPAGVAVAVGRPAGGVAGFRRSHQQAADVQRVVAGAQAPDPVQAAARLITYDEVQVVALAGTDVARAGEFARTALGGLLDGRPELREALRVHLLEHRSATRAAARLFTHRNTMLNRVARAEALLPRPLEDQPLAVLLALELDHWLDLG